MGIYSPNRSSSVGNIQVEAATGYHGLIGVQLAMIEGYENDLALFDCGIMKDFEEAGMVHEGAGEEEIYALQESSGSGFLENIKQFFIKLWEKIKGIFQSFMSKFDSVVMRDSKAFHDKYSKAVYAKDLSKMKAKFSKPKAKLSTLEFSNLTGVAGLQLDASSWMGGSGASQIEKLVGDFERDEFVCKILNDCKPTVNISEEKEYAKDVHEALFDDEEEQEGFSSIIHEMGGILVAKSTIEAVKKSNTSLEKAIAAMIKEIDKSKNAVIKFMPAKDGNNVSGVKHKFGVDSADGKHKSAEGLKFGDNPDNRAQSGSVVTNLQKGLNYVHTQATCIQSAALKFTAVALNETKFELAQARRIFAAAVAHNPKNVNESAILSEAMQEAAEYEIMSSFECY